MAEQIATKIAIRSCFNVLFILRYFFKGYKRKKLLTVGHVGFSSEALGDVTKYFVLSTDTHLVDISERAKSFEMLKGQINAVIVMYFNIQGCEMSEN